MWGGIIMDDKDAMSKEEEKKVTDRINELYMQ